MGLSFALALTAPAALSAHEGHTQKVMGAVTAIEADEIEVATSDGHKVKLGLNEETRFRSGNRPAAAADVKVGGRVVVMSGAGNGKPVAREVLLPPATQVESGGSDR